MRPQLAGPLPSAEPRPVLQLVLESALDGVVVMRADGVVDDWNAQAEVIFGWSRAEAVGRLLADLVIPAPLREAHRAGLDRFLATGEGPLLRRRIEVTAMRRSGETFPIELSISPVEADGRPAFLGFVRDITERRSAEELLKRQAREAEVLNEITRLAAETDSLEEILRHCLASVCELTGWAAGHAYLPLGTDPVRLTSDGVWHGRPELASGGAPAAETTFAPGEGLPGRVWATREACWSPQVARSDARGWLVDQAGARSTFATPIISGGAVSAVLEFFCGDTTQPDPRLLHIVRTLGEQVGRVLERRAVQARQTLLLAEMDHRAKNMLAVVLGMADQTARRAESVEGFQQAFSARLDALARGYSLVTAGRWRATSMEDVVREIVQPYLSEGQAQLQMGGDTVVLPPKAALAVAMILHELVANATKYGALSTPDGRISIGWRVAAAQARRVVELVWRETGLNGLVPPTRLGFGSKLIETSTRLELNGEVRTDFAPDGISYSFKFPEPVAGPGI